MRKTLIPTIATVLLAPGMAGANLHVMGWQTFENRLSGDNNSGIVDNTPDTNSSFDPTPVGSNSNGLYLTGAIGDNASNLGWDGFGQSTDSGFLNGSTFGNNNVPPGLLITDWPLADGSPGMRIGPFGDPGASSWKFSSQNSPNQLLGDFSITNESDYAFRLERIHFDARTLGAATSADSLELRYLAEPSNLINASTGTEVQDQRVFWSNTWTAVGVENVSPSISSVINSAARLGPGETAAFRFLWSRTNTPTGGGQSQIDNLAFSGTFLDQNNGFVEIDPTTVGDTVIDGDFDDNGFYECADVDALVTDIVSGNDTPSFDMTGDGLVDAADLTAWRVEAGDVGGLTLSGNPVLPGDANLDGNVDGLDFVVWNSSKFTNTAAWCNGDFNADGNVDGQDFIVWNNFKFTSADATVVPEPTSLLPIALLLSFALVRRSSERH